MLTALRIDPHAAPDVAAQALLARELPTLTIERAPGEPADVEVTASEWARPSWHPFATDAELVPALARDACVLHVRGGEPWTSGALVAIATRYQRYVRVTPPLPVAKVLRAHRELHDLANPLVAADYDHALDAWRWLLRIAPTASVPLQLAVLFHDVDRLVDESDDRLAHAALGAEVAEYVLASEGIDRATRERAAALIASHPRPSDDEELALLSDADALSFFSLNSAGFHHYFGDGPTREKVSCTLARLRPVQRLRLAEMRLTRAIAGFVAEAQLDLTG